MPNSVLRLFKSQTVNLVGLSQGEHFTLLNTTYGFPNFVEQM